MSFLGVYIYYITTSEMVRGNLQKMMMLMIRHYIYLASMPAIRWVYASCECVKSQNLVNKAFICRKQRVCGLSAKQIILQHSVISID